MAPFTDFNVQPIRVPDFRGRREQLLALEDERRIRQNQLREGDLRFQALQRGFADEEARRGAMAAGVVPGQSATINNPLSVGGVDIPQTSKVQTPARFDRFAALQNLAQQRPELVPGMQQEFGAQDAARQEQELKLAEVLQKLDKGKLEAIKGRAEMTGQMLGAVMQAPPEMQPRIYAQLRQQAIQQGLADEQTIPPNFDPAWVQAQASSTMKVKEMVDAAQAKATAAETGRHNKATEAQAGATLAETKRHNVSTEANAQARLEAGEGRKVQLTRKDITQAEQKLTNIRLARQQLAQVKEKFAKIKDTLSAGPGQALPTEKGSNFDAAVDQMRSIISGITRVPGIGSMSDYETRLQQAQFPSRGQYESTTEQKIQGIDDMLNLLETGYTDMLQQGGPQMQQRREGDTKQFPNGKVGKWDGQGWVLQP
jgi:hypothetical protein